MGIVWSNKTVKLNNDYMGVADAVEDIYRGIPSLQWIGEQYRNAKNVVPNGKYIIKALRGSSISYSEVEGSMNDKYVNFCGLMLNLNTFSICLGINSFSTVYVPVLSFKDLLNAILFRDLNKNIFSDNDVIYIIENLKLFSSGFDLRQLVVDLTPKDDYRIYGFNSVILSYIHKDREKRNPKSHYFEDNFHNGEEVLKVLVDSCIVLSKNLENISNKIFKNFIVEDSVTEEVTDSGKVSTKDLLSFNSNKHSLENLRLRAIASGISSTFVNSLATYGFAKNKRKVLLSEIFTEERGSLYGVPFGTSGSALSVLSSLAYADVNSKTKIISGINMSCVHCYNVIDLIRASGWDQDLLFSYVFQHSYKNNVLVNSIFGKFSLEDILATLNITSDVFRDCTIRYFSLLGCLRDSNSMYSCKVRLEQYQLGVFSGASIYSSGKVFTKISNRILKKL